MYMHKRGMLKAKESIYINTSRAMIARKKIAKKIIKDEIANCFVLRV